MPIEVQADSTIQVQVVVQAPEEETVQADSTVAVQVVLPQFNIYEIGL